MHRLIFATIGLTLVTAVVFYAGSPRTYAEDITIEVGNLYFCGVPHQEGICERTVTAGDTVTWNNIAGFHTVTECDESFVTCPPAGGFDSGPLPSGNTFSHTFDTPGVFAYFCAFHPTSMRGRITVQAAPTPTPSPTAGPTAAPSGTSSPASPVTASPASVPRTGGPMNTGGTSSVGALALMAGGALLLAGAAAIARTGTRERR